MVGGDPVWRGPDWGGPERVAGTRAGGGDPGQSLNGWTLSRVVPHSYPPRQCLLV
jgi:hypothetical protein